MANNKKTTENTETKFTIKKLRDYSLKLFGVPTSTFDGATAKYDDSETFTVDEVKDIIKEWKKKEAK